MTEWGALCMEFLLEYILYNERKEKYNINSQAHQEEVFLNLGVSYLHINKTLE